MDGFLFEMVGLDSDRWSVGDAVLALEAAVEGAGSSVVEEPPVGSWHRIGLSGGPLDGASVMVSAAPPGWSFSVVDQQLGDDDDPIDAAQRALVELLRRCIAAVPLYLGVAVWPFGPEVPEVYDTAAPFTARAAGPVTFVSGRYVDAVLGGALDPPKRWAVEPLGGGHLLVVSGNLLRGPEDPSVRKLLKRLQPRRAPDG